MMSKKNVPELRFPEFNGEWEKKKMSQVLFERKVKQNISEEAPLLAFASGQGVIERKHKKTNKRDFLTKDSKNKKYLLTKFDDIVYNPSNLKYGAIDRNTLGTGLISPIYVTFETSHFPQFVEMLVKDYRFQQKALRYEEGTVTKRQAVKPEYLLAIKEFFPSFSEQKKIGEFFSMLDRLIELEEKKLELLEEQKKGYMQKIFSQELRFKDENGNDYPEWETVRIKDIFNYERPDKYIVDNTDYQERGVPVLTANKAFVLGYTTENNFYDKGKCIIFDDFTLDNKYIDFPFKVKSSAIKILTTKKGHYTHYAYYLLNQVKFIKEGHARHYISVVQPTKVAVPCEEEQKKIGDYIKTFDYLFELQEKKLMSLIKVKQGLLQKLFL